MCTRLFLSISVMLFSSFVAPVRANQQGDAAQSTEDTAMEGTVVSVSHQTLVLRSDDNRFQLFTYDRPSVPPVSPAQAVRVRVTAGAADENDVRAASSLSILPTNHDACRSISAGSLCKNAIRYKSAWR